MLGKSIDVAHDRGQLRIRGGGALVATPTKSVAPRFRGQGAKLVGCKLVWSDDAGGKLRVDYRIGVIRRGTQDVVVVDAGNGLLGETPDYHVSLGRIDREQGVPLTFPSRDASRGRSATLARELLSSWGFHVTTLGVGRLRIPTVLPFQSRWAAIAGGALARRIASERIRDAAGLPARWPHQPGGGLAAELNEGLRTAIRCGVELDEKLLTLVDPEPERRCRMCDFSFEEKYGALGRGFLEIHVVRRRWSPQRPLRPCDLVPLCANCHRMLHRGSSVTRMQTLSRAMDAAARVEREPWLPSIKSFPGNGPAPSPIKNSSGD